MMIIPMKLIIVTVVIVLKLLALKGRSHEIETG
jgi:hypothetical protein